MKKIAVVLCLIISAQSLCHGWDTAETRRQKRELRDKYENAGSVDPETFKRDRELAERYGLEISSTAAPSKGMSPRDKATLDFVAGGALLVLGVFQISDSSKHASKADDYTRAAELARQLNLSIIAAAFKREAEHEESERSEAATFGVISIIGAVICIAVGSSELQKVPKDVKRTARLIVRPEYLGVSYEF